MLISSLPTSKDADYKEYAAQFKNETEIFHATEMITTGLEEMLINEREVLSEIEGMDLDLGFELTDDKALVNFLETAMDEI